jgi:hypothetical protein
MREIAIYLAMALVATVCLALSIVTIRYRVTTRSVVITWLGLPLRWIRLTNIQGITFHRVFWAEKWFNTFSPGNRYLVIHKNFGIVFKSLVITPRNHMVFRADIDRARARLMAPVNVVSATSLAQPPTVPAHPAQTSVG